MGRSSRPVPFAFRVALPSRSEVHGHQQQDAPDGYENDTDAWIALLNEQPAEKEPGGQKNGRTEQAGRHEIQSAGDPPGRMVHGAGENQVEHRE